MAALSGETRNVSDQTGIFLDHGRSQKEILVMHIIETFLRAPTFGSARFPFYEDAVDLPTGWLIVYSVQEGGVGFARISSRQELSVSQHSLALPPERADVLSE